MQPDRRKKKKRKKEGTGWDATMASLSRLGTYFQASRANLRLQGRASLLSCATAFQVGI